MFDIGWGELLLIGVVALIVIGPKELPGTLRTLGQWMGKLRRMASEFQGQFQEAMREAEMSDLKKHADDLNNAAKQLTNFEHYDPLKDTGTTKLAGDAAAGLKLIAHGGADLVLLDVMLPGEDGLDFCRRVRALSNLPIIMLTALGQGPHRVAGLDAGADDYVAKPFDSDEHLFEPWWGGERALVAIGPAEAIGNGLVA